MNGSVIDHTDAKMIAALRFPIVDSDLISDTARSFRSAFEAREAARLQLVNVQKRYIAHFGLERWREVKNERRFGTQRNALSERIDVEPRAPIYDALREMIGDRGCALSDIANVFRPGSRYKTNYVQDSRFGLRLMNGRQIAQYRPIALKLMNISGFKNSSDFLLKEGMTLLTADGRAEENLADCALVTSDRAGWAASGHVHRVAPRDGIDAGLVYLACSCGPVQLQLKALATGSVVDGLSPSDVGSVRCPTKAQRKLVSLGKMHSARGSSFPKQVVWRLPRPRHLRPHFPKDLAFNPSQ